MSRITALARHFGAFLVPVQARASQPEAMSLRDWADLPAYHPKSDRTPR